MAFEDEVKTVMRDAAGNEPSAGDAWGRFERRARRDRAARAAGLLAVAAAMVAVSLVAIPRITGTTEEGGFVRPGGDPVPQETRAPEPRTESFEGGIEYIDRDARVRLRFPDGWVEVPGGPDGTLTISPEDFAGGLHDGEQMDPRDAPASAFLSIMPLRDSHQATVKRQRDAYARHAEEGADVSETTEVSIAGRTTHSFGLVYPDRMPEPKPAGWCGGCRLSNWIVEWVDGWTLDVVFVTRDAEATDRFMPAGLEIASTIEVLGEDVETFGAFAPGVAQDDLSAALQAFLDARVRGREAMDWLTPDAWDQYSAGELRLYVRGADAYLSGWYVESRQDADANSAEFVVSFGITYGEGNDAVEQMIERIAIGPAEDLSGAAKPALVRFALACRDVACA